MPTKRECPKCKGKGRIDAYAHVKRGECFRCNGTGLCSMSEDDVPAVDSKPKPVRESVRVIVPATLFS